MTTAAEESAEEIKSAIIKVLNGAKVPKSNDVIPKVDALMRVMMALTTATPRQAHQGRKRRPFHPRPPGYLARRQS